MGPRVVATLSVLNADPLRARSRENYLKALRDVGCDVVAVDADHPAPDEFDALCLSGGEDMEPARYGAAIDPKTEAADPRRDALELALVAKARARDVPVLAICRGFQVVNVAYGGSLVQHVEGHREKNGPIVPHTAAATPGSKLAEACGTEPFSVNAFRTEGDEAKVTTLRVDESVAARQRERLAALRTRRDAGRVARLRGDLRAAAAGTENLMPRIVAAVEGDVTLGEICADLRDAFGSYVPADRG